MQVLQGSDDRVLRQLTEDLSRDRVDEHREEPISARYMGEIGRSRGGRRVDAGNATSRTRVTEDVEHGERLGQRTVGARGEQVRVNGALKIDAEDQCRTGEGHDDQVEGGEHTDPQMHLKQRAPHEHGPGLVEEHAHGDPSQRRTTTDPRDGG